MKTNPFLIPAVTILFAGLLSLCSAQPAHIDPATGLPAVPGAAGAPSRDPVTGAFLPPGMSPEAKAAQAQADSIMEVHKLIASGDYDEALKECLAFQSQLKGDKTIGPLIPDWVELGRRFPAAREELLKIRDHDVAEFSTGRGYAVLFGEIKDINAAWNEDDATEALFKSIRSQDPKLADECYGTVQDLLMQKGEYTFCLECIGDPRTKFDGILNGFQMQVDMQQRLNAMRQFTEEQSKRFNHPTMPSFYHFDQGKMATNNFVGQVVVLEKILVGAGRQADAEIIRDQALAVVDNDRIRNAIPVTESKSQK